MCTVSVDAGRDGRDKMGCDAMDRDGRMDGWMHGKGEVVSHVA